MPKYMLCLNINSNQQSLHFLLNLSHSYFSGNTQRLSSYIRFVLEDSKLIYFYSEEFTCSFLPDSLRVMGMFAFFFPSRNMLFHFITDKGEQLSFSQTHILSFSHILLSLGILLEIVISARMFCY